jgi:hypothetical protein
MRNHERSAQPKPADRTGAGVLRGTPRSAIAPRVFVAIRVSSARIRVSSALIRISGARIRISGARIRISSTLIRVSGARIRVSSTRIRISSTLIRVSGARIRVSSTRIRISSTRFATCSRCTVRFAQNALRNPWSVPSSHSRAWHLEYSRV